MTVFFREEHVHLETRLEQQEAKLEQQRQEMEAKLEQQRQETEQQRQEAEQQRHNTKLQEEVRLREQAQIAALQSRVQALHGAQLLGDEELYGLEDIIVDSCETDVTDDDDDRVAKMVSLSGMLADGAFARQLRRKFL